jgi:hypothetical protein
MSNFAFLEAEWPDLYDVASNAESCLGAVEKLKTAQRAALAELDALFSSLQHRAFRGEL